MEQVEACQDQMYMELDNVIECKLKLTEFTDDEMDIDYDSVVDAMVMTHPVSQPKSYPLHASTQSKGISNTSTQLLNQILQHDWSTQMSLAPRLDLNSTCAFNSFPLSQQLFGYPGCFCEIFSLLF